MTWYRTRRPCSLRQILLKNDAGLPIAITDPHPSFAHPADRTSTSLCPPKGFQGLASLGNPCPHIAPPDQPEPQFLELRIDHNLTNDRRLNLGRFRIKCRPNLDRSVQCKAQDIVR